VDRTTKYDPLENYDFEQQLKEHQFVPALDVVQ
jgi:hypothetical protein